MTADHESDAAAAKARNICLRLLTGQPRSRAELAAALQRREIPDAVATGVLDRLTEVGLIDDAAYAQVLVTSKQRTRGLGKAALRRELVKKGIDDELAAQALTEIDDDAERSRAEALVETKLRSMPSVSRQTAERRLLAMLGRRGYRSSMAISVVRQGLDDYRSDGGSA